MKRLSTILALVLVLSMGSFGPWVSQAEAQPCGRSQCVSITGCFQCQDLILLIIECVPIRCDLCVNVFCDSAASSTASLPGSDQAATETVCKDSEEVEPPAVRVVALEWKEDRT